MFTRRNIKDGVILKSNFFPRLSLAQPFMILSDTPGRVVRTLGAMAIVHGLNYSASAGK